MTRGPDRRVEPYRIVAEIEDPANLEAAALVGGSEAVLLDKGETIARLIVQTSRQAGAAAVYVELLDFDGEEIYFRHDERLTGKTYVEALLAYEDCSIMGIRTPDGVTVNPAGDTRAGSRRRDRRGGRGRQRAPAGCADPRGGRRRPDHGTSSPSQIVHTAR